MSIIRLIAMSVALCLGTAAIAQEGRDDSGIAPQPLNTALKEFADRSGLQVIYVADLADGKDTFGAKANLSDAETLEQLLASTGLEYEFINANTVTVQAVADEERSSDPGKSRATPRPMMMAQASGEADRKIEEEQDREQRSSAAAQRERTIEEVTVTGTRIRGGVTPSPVIEISAQRIQEEGFTDLGELIRSVPQNFGGGLNPGVVTATGSGNISNQGGSGGSALNLRGIGPDATLTLLNGRRLAYNGFGQAVDISAIPIEAVERIEIVADGTSAIYGSDAVAGVGNVVLQRDLEGVAVGARHGWSSRSGLNTKDYNATAGTIWESGGLLATYKDVSTDPISADQRKYTAYMDTPFFLYPSSSLKSGLISGYQSLGDSIELRIDALRTTRETVWYQNLSGTFYENRPETTNSFVSPSIEFLLPGDWSIQAAGSWAKSEALGDSWMVIPERGESTHVAASCWCNDGNSYELSGEGPLFELGGGQARLAVGLGYRSNELLNENYLSGRKLYGSGSSRFAYTEMSLPLIASGSDARLADRLTVTAAARVESYDSFGGVTTPKLGLIYGPNKDFTFKASWGRSFKAPTLSSQYGSRAVYLVPPAVIGGVGYGEEDAVLLSWGSTADLRPERARTTSVSLGVHPQSVRGLDVELTLFDIDYDDRVVQPFAAFGQILSNDAVVDFIDWAPTSEEQAALIAEYSTNGFLNQTGRPYDPNAVVAIGRGEFTNAMRQRIKGLDLSGEYRFEAGRGTLTVRGSASWLDSEQRNIPGQEEFDLAGTIFYPAKRSSRLGVLWTEGAIMASLFANYRSGVTHHVTGKKTASFTTFDSTLRYVVESSQRLVPALEFALTAENLLDRPPPLYIPAVVTDVPYDSTNYSAIGRFISASVSMRW